MLLELLHQKALLLVLLKIALRGEERLLDDFLKIDPLKAVAPFQQRLHILSGLHSLIAEPIGDFGVGVRRAKGFLGCWLAGKRVSRSRSRLQGGHRCESRWRGYLLLLAHLSH